MISPTFHTLITQPTTLCNLDCSYCYLPNRKQARLMAPAVARALAASVKKQDRYPVDVVWHGGEPLATPIAHMRELLAPFESLRGLIKHGVQTNATLIDDAWCELLLAHRFEVGISIDGPAIHNAARVDWAGRETFTRTMRGVGRLREAGISYSAICVVTPETVGRVNELEQFFTDLGCTSVGFNLEEQEGLNAHRPVIAVADAETFWLRLWQLRETGSLAVRDLDRFCDWLNARCVFRGCSLIGAHLTDTTLKNVIFENCRFDYATFTAVRTTGPVALLGCSLTETVFDRCKLSTLVIDGCKLNAPIFTACDMRGADLRGNDLSKTIGVTTSLRGTILSEDQVIGFTEAVTRELELTIRETSRTL